MEFRVLQYFLAVAREESVSGAAEFLHLSQPTLSRQLKDLENELGKQLFIRGNRKITLTEEGHLLRKRAEEIVDLMKKTEDEITQSEDSVAGELYIGAAEAEAVRFLAQRAHRLQMKYPLIRYHISSGDRESVMEQLNKGLIDFALVHDEVDSTRYESLTIPFKNTWGVLMRRDSSLAQKDFVTLEDLTKIPIITSRQMYKRPDSHLPSRQDLPLQVVATYNLLYNASLMVEEGMGFALCFDHIINTGGDSCLCFKPLVPTIETTMFIVWKRYQIFSKPAELFLKKLKEA